MHNDVGSVINMSELGEDDTLLQNGDGKYVPSSQSQPSSDCDFSLKVKAFSASIF
ncbi:hypothetical protein HanPI659440_Chr05g0195471 [Helianthus annuus]|nr:hypothetical protein HanPI659440_Chr05g0195471 [Helianthus annuus]